MTEQSSSRSPVMFAYKEARVHETTLRRKESWQPHWEAPGAKTVGQMRGICPGLEGANFAVGLVIIPPGQITPVHYYTGEHIIIQLSGSTRFVIEGEEFVLTTMDSLFIPANVSYYYGSVGLDESRFVNAIGRVDEWPAMTHYPEL